MPRTTTHGTRIDSRRAATVGLASFATLALVPLLAHAKPGERALLLLAAVPTAALFGYLAGYAAGSGSPRHAALPDASPSTASPSAPDRHRLSLVPPPPTRASTTARAVGDAAATGGGPGGGPHLTLVAAHRTQHPVG